MVFLLGALCYTMCTMKAPPQALEGPREDSEPSWHLPFHGIYKSLLSRPFQGLERRLHGIPVWCSVLYNMHHEGSSPDPSSLHGIYHFMAFTEASSPGPSRAWRGGFMVFQFGALCYTICTMKAFMAFTIYRSLLSRPFQGLERRLHGIPVWCSVLYNMHHEGSSQGPGRARGGAFMAFKLAKVLDNSHATHGIGVAWHL